MRFLYLLAFILPQIGFASSAKIDPQIPIEWERLKLESALHEKVEKTLLGLMTNKDFVVNVIVTLDSKSIRKPTSTDTTKAPKGSLYLDKLGMWAVTGHRKGSELFSSIKDIQVKALVHDAILDEKKDSIELALNQALSGFKKNNVKLDIQGAQLKSWWTDMSSTWALLLAVLLLCLTYFVVGILKIKYGVAAKTSLEGGGEAREVGGGAALGGATASTASGAPAVAGGAASVVSGGGAVASGSAAPMIGSSSGGFSGGPSFGAESFSSQDMVGFKQFRGMIKTEPKIVVQLIKQWLHNNSDQAQVCLGVLAKSDFVHEFLPLVTQLNPQERKRWQACNRMNLQADAIENTNLFLAQVLFDRALIPPIVSSVELQKVLSEIGPEDCVPLAETQPKFLALLLNALPSDQATEIFKLIPTEQAATVTEESLVLQAGEVSKKISAMKKELAEISQHADEEEKAPFYDVISGIFGQVNVEKEQVLFDALEKSKDYKTYVSLAKQYFPMNFVWDLPSPSLRAIFSQMPSKDRSELIYGLSDERKEQVFEILGEGKVRELLDLELEEIASDEVRAKSVVKRHSQLWELFVQIVRNVIKTDEELSMQAEQLLDTWMEEHLSGKGNQDDTTAA